LGTTSVRDPIIRLSTQKSGLTVSSEMAGLIGPDVLSQFDVTFDYQRNRMILERNRDYGRRDSYDRAGLWMGQETNDRFVAVDVISGGPADEAGVRPGDSILAIDGRSAVNLVLPDVRESMRRRSPGEKIALLLESRGQQRTVIVTLRDLV
jgi:C-terminal processing protease CtpA/Prc